MITKHINTIVAAKLPEREGEFAFTLARIAKVKNGRLLVQLADDEGHVLSISLKVSDLRRLFSGQPPISI